MLNILECMEASKDYRNEGDVYIRAEGHIGKGGVQNFVCGDGIACLVTMAKMIVSSCEKSDIPVGIALEILKDEIRAARKAKNDAE